MPNNRRGFGARIASDTIAASTEKLTNPSFESSGTVLTGWTIDDQVTASVNTNSAYVQLGSRSAHANWLDIDDTLNQNVTGLIANATYLLTGYIYVVTGVAMVEMWDSAIGLNGEALCAQAFTYSGQFEEFTLIFQALHTSAEFRLCAHYDFSDVYLDNLSLKAMN